ncbi:hypothetical protein GW17_00048331 [Ensete ventricosum]|nr:hypothetical protein GW17_00048331 [Ensete ventricosum]
MQSSTALHLHRRQHKCKVTKGSLDKRCCRNRCNSKRSDRSSGDPNFGSRLGSAQQVSDAAHLHKENVVDLIVRCPTSLYIYIDADAITE